MDDLAYILEVSEVMIGTELRVIILGSSCMHLLSRSVFMASCSEEAIHDGLREENSINSVHADC